MLADAVPLLVVLLTFLLCTYCRRGTQPLAICQPLLGIIVAMRREETIGACDMKCFGSGMLEVRRKASPKTHGTLFFSRAISRGNEI